MKKSILTLLVFLVGCSSSTVNAPAEASQKEPDVYARYVCELPKDNGSIGTKEFKTPWVIKDNLFTGSKCNEGNSICWWAKAPKQFDKDSTHKYFYVPVPGSVCHYEETGGKKPNDWD